MTSWAKFSKLAVYFTLAYIIYVAIWYIYIDNVGAVYLFYAIKESIQPDVTEQAQSLKRNY